MLNKTTKYKCVFYHAKNVKYVFIGIRIIFRIDVNVFIVDQPLYFFFIFFFKIKITVERFYENAYIFIISIKLDSFYQQAEK